MSSYNEFKSRAWVDTSVAFPGDIHCRQQMQKHGLGCTRQNAADRARSYITHCNSRYSDSDNLLVKRSAAVAAPRAGRGMRDGRPIASTCKSCANDEIAVV